MSNEETPIPKNFREAIFGVPTTPEQRLERMKAERAKWTNALHAVKSARTELRELAVIGFRCDHSDKAGEQLAILQHELEENLAWPVSP